MKMATEGRFGKPCRQDWPQFLTRVIPASVWQAFGDKVRQVKRVDARWSAKYVVLCWVIMGWSTQAQLTERFRESREVLVRLFARRRRPGRSYQGLVNAGHEMGEPVFQHFWACLRKTMARRVGAHWWWYGWVVMAVDGSRIDAPRTRSNERALGIAGRPKTHPQWWVTAITHLPSHLIWDWRQGPGVSDERRHLREMLPALPHRTLLLGDIGFCHFDLMWELCRRQLEFVIRVGGHTTLLAEVGRHAIEKRGDHRYVYFFPLRRRGLPPLPLRLIVLKRKGKRVYLLTNVFDSARLSRSMASDLYAARWDIEVSYRSLKQTLGHRKVLARTPQVGVMELAGRILALAILLLQTAWLQGVKLAHASISEALRLLRRALEAVRFGQRSYRFIKALRGALRDRYRRRRPKGARDWPHKKKERMPGPPILRRPTAGERALINRYWSRSDVDYG